MHQTWASLDLTAGTTCGLSCVAGNYFVASCGDHRPYACAVFGLGSPGDDYARTPAEQFFARDYHAVVINPTTFGAVDAMTAVSLGTLRRTTHARR